MVISGRGAYTKASRANMATNTRIPHAGIFSYSVLCLYDIVLFY